MIISVKIEEKKIFINYFYGMNFGNLPKIHFDFRLQPPRTLRSMLKNVVQASFGWKSGFRLTFYA